MTRGLQKLPARGRLEPMTARWIKMRHQLEVRSLITNKTHQGECTHLSVEGMVFLADFVPQHAERLEVTMLPADIGAYRATPFVAETEVRHCYRHTDGERYEIGVVIRERKR